MNWVVARTVGSETLVNGRKVSTREMLLLTFCCQFTYPERMKRRRRSTTNFYGGWGRKRRRLNNHPTDFEYTCQHWGGLRYMPMKRTSTREITEGEEGRKVNK